jgi:hypothetical protein
MTRLFHTVRFHSRSRTTKQSDQILAVEKPECNGYSGSEVIRLSNIQTTPAGNCSMAVQIDEMTLSWMLVLPVDLSSLLIMAYTWRACLISFCEGSL